MTKRIEVDAGRPEQERIREAAELLARGGLVAFPTETVYGLGARASDAAAARAIFEAKERPATSALIVHVSGIEQAKRYASSWSDAADRLARAFWPGPLSLVLPRSTLVPDVVAAGGKTVAMRAPAHPVALALIDALGEGIAAPSANRSSRVPPVRASHVLKGLDGRIDAVLDAGACPGGLESTVLLIEGERGRVLRRGAVGIDALRKHLEVEDAPSAPVSSSTEGWIRIVGREQLSSSCDDTVGLLLLRDAAGVRGHKRVLGESAERYASAMYDALQELEDEGCEVVLAERMPGEPRWDAIRDRLMRLG